MKKYQKKFIELSLKAKALKFGDFTLKSGRQSPYFFNAASLIEYGELSILADYLKAKVKEDGLKFDMIFGPAYKGIFLATLLANKMSEKKRMPVCFNRKEIKDHGEGGMLIGAKPKGKVLIVDDVLSSGLAISESVNFLSFYDVEIVGALVTLNRLEKGLNTDNTASGELELKGINIFQIISLDDLLEADELISKENAKKMKEYRENYRGNDV